MEIVRGWVYCSEWVFMLECTENLNININIKVMFNLLKKVLFGLFLIILTSGVAMAAGYHDKDTIPCYDITGATQPVLVPGVGGVNNGGILDFDADVDVVDPQYAACLRMSSSAADAKPDHLEGWVRSDNLGWISLYCKGGKNLDADCGSINYGVTFTATGTGPDYSAVNTNANSYIWGDNVGWITFYTPLSHRITPLSSGADRGLISISLSVARRYAWSDSIGWFDFTGVKLYWENALPEVVTVCCDSDPTCTCDLVDPDAATCTIVPPPPLADGSDACETKITFPVPPEELKNVTCENIPMTTVNPDGDGLDYAYCIEFAWLDTVSQDQTTLASQSDDYSTAVNPVVSKPIGAQTVGAGTATFTFDVLSKAPTSDANVSTTVKGVDFPNEKFYYAAPSDITATDGLYDKKSIGNNILKLLSLKVMLFKYKSATSLGQCVVGDEVAGQCRPAEINNINYPFAPPVRVNNMSFGKTTLLDYMALLRDDIANVNYDLTNDSVSGVSSFSTVFKLGVEDSDALTEAGYQFNLATSADDRTSIDNTQTVTAVQTGSWFPLLSVLDEENPPSSAPTEISPYLFSKITYTLTDSTVVTFFSDKLPKVAAGLAKNPVAYIKGSVYGSSFTSGAGNMSLNNLGNVNTNIARDRIWATVNGLLAGVSIPDMYPPMQTVITNFGDIPNMTALGNNTYYIKSRGVVINCTNTDCGLTQNTTLIVQDSSVYIQSNIMPTGGKQLGIIVFDDYENPLDVTQNSVGNLYIKSNVTDILNTHVYLDGLMMSYYSGVLGGWPLFTDDVDRAEKLNNQLRFVGTLSSSNGFGNSYGTSPTDQNGKAATGSSTYAISPSTYPNGIALARTVDLNFLRYYGAGVQLCDNGEIKDQQLLALGTGRECDPDDVDRDIDLTHLNSDATPGDMVSGSSTGTKSAFYATKTGLDAEYPTYFEYQPVSATLSGFNQVVEVK
jgi:hypothetical protein